MAEKVFVDLDEEITFIADKISEINDDRIILIVPEQAALLGSVVSLKLLFSEISKLGKSAVLVTNDEVGLKLARNAKFLAKGKVSDITDATWEKAQKLREEFRQKKGKTKEELLDERHERVMDTSTKPSKEKEEATSVPEIAPKKVNIGGFEMMAGGDIAEIESVSAKDIPASSVGEATKVTSSSISKPGLSSSLREKSSALETGSHEEYDSGLLGRDLSSRSYTSLAQSQKSKSKKTDGPSISEKVGNIAAAVKDFFVKGGNRTKILIGVGILIVVFFIISYFVLPSGKVVISVESEDVQLQKEVFADTSVSVLDAENLTIPAKILESSKDRSDTADTTGKKPTGDVASGQVTLYNKTESEITIQAGTVLECIETGTKYKTVSAVTIDAVQSDEDPNPGSYGVADVGVEAENFGEEYNLEEKKEFRVQGFDIANIYGKNFNNITGGTSEEVQVVSKSDIENLKGELEEQLKADLIESLKTEAGSTRVLLEDTIQYEVVNETASPGEDEEATTFNLSLTLKATALSFLSEDVDNLAKTLVEQNDEQQIEIEEFEYQSKVLSTEGTKIKLELSITGVVTPSLDETDLQTNLAGKTGASASKYLDEQEQIKDYEIKLYPVWLPSFLRHFPSSTSKVEVEIQKV